MGVLFASRHVSRYDSDNAIRKTGSSICLSTSSNAS
jgi:hypothetical protein